MRHLAAQQSEYASTTGNTSVVTFGYDDRHRLTSESRTQDNPYSLSYTYDELGSRKRDRVHLTTHRRPRVPLRQPRPANEPCANSNLPLSLMLVIAEVRVCLRAISGQHFL